MIESSECYQTYWKEEAKYVRKLSSKNVRIEKFSAKSNNTGQISPRLLWKKNDHPSEQTEKIWKVFQHLKFWTDILHRIAIVNFPKTTSLNTNRFIASEDNASRRTETTPAAEPKSTPQQSIALRCPNRTYLWIETMFQSNNVRVRIFDELSHDLQLAIFEPLVLQDFLNRHNLIRFHDLCFKDDSKTSISNDSFRRIANVFRLLLLCLSVGWRGGSPHGGMGSSCGCRCLSRRRWVLFNAASAVGSARARHGSGRWIWLCTSTVIVADVCNGIGRCGLGRRRCLSREWWGLRSRVCCFNSGSAAASGRCSRNRCHME